MPKRYRSKRRFRRKRRTRKSKLNKYQRRNKAAAKLSMAAPQVWKYVNSYEVDATAHNQYFYPLAQAYTGGNTTHASKDTNVEIYNWLANTLGIAAADMKRYNYVIASSQSEILMKNSGKHEIEFFIWKLVPKISICKEIYTEFTATNHDFTDLVMKIMDREHGTGVGSSVVTTTLYDYDIVKKYFKIVKCRKRCLLPGETLRLRVQGKRWYRVDGAFMEDSGNDMFSHPNGYKGVITFIQCRGTIAHDVTSDNLVGRMGGFLDVVYKSKITGYAVPSQKKNIVVSGTLDTMADAEAIHPNDLGPANQAEH